jgi:hypothetical protein
VLAFARASGRWDEIERATREGVACARHAATLTAEQADLEAVVEQAGDEFRYDRDLLTADEMEEWLDAHGLDARRWIDAIRRRVLRERWASQLAELLAHYRPTDEEIEEALADDLVVAELHAELARELAGEAAAAASAGATGTPDGDRLAAIRAAAARFRAAAATDEAIRREIANHQMDWVRIECRAVEFAHEPEAREAALCLREDGLPLEDVAREAHVAVGSLAFYLEDVDADDRSRFLGAHAGHVVGPIAIDDVHVLYHVDRKVMPGPQDPGVLARATTLVTARAVALELQHRVQWLAEGVEIR